MEKNMKIKIGILLVAVLLVTGLGGVVYAQEPPSSSPAQAVEGQEPPLSLPAGASDVITFDEFPVGTYITNQYQDVGIIFGGDAPVITPDGANPTSPVLAGTIPDLFRGDITGTFVVPGTDTPTTVCAFGFDAGYFDDIGSTSIEWFDEYGNSLGIIYNSQTVIEHFAIEGSNIASWEIAEIAFDLFAIDNVWFEPCPLPPSCIYLHCEDGLFNLTEPVGTRWDELYPLFGRAYHFSSWEDNGDGILSYCDTINMYEKPSGELRPYHVEEVTITLLVSENRTDEAMYIELEGGYNETALGKPIGTLWHEIYPDFCTTYNITGWDDNGSSVLDYCDYISFTEGGFNFTGCDYEICLADSYGDGWNGGNIDVFVNGNPVYTDLTLASGYGPGCHPIPVQNGDEITVDWTAGSYPYENEYYIYDSDGALVRSEGTGGATPGDVLSGELYAICPYPYYWHVEDVAIDIVVCREPPPVGGEAYPVSKASLLAPWIAGGVLLAGGISWYVLKRRRAQS